MWYIHPKYYCRNFWNKRDVSWLLHSQQRIQTTELSRRENFGMLEKKAAFAVSK
jgi:hypothetical protein